MLHFIAAFYALLFSFCHAGSVRQAEAQLQPEAPVTYGVYAPGQQTLDQQEVAASYAGAACASCQMTTVTYNVR